ncbi:MAG TPA: extracellular solute-binding protein [Rhodospirillaceae bacterium]|nr:extracellular solute-binding protein [Rhodospirillaceae bacterium]
MNRRPGCRGLLRMAFIIGKMRVLPGLVALCFAVSAALAAPMAELEFSVPSGATTEVSRFYYQLVQEFEAANPGIKISFRPLTDWDEVVRVVSAPDRPKAGVFVAEASETLELEQRRAITPVEDLLTSEPGGLKDFLAAFIPEFLGNSLCADKTFCSPPFIRSTPVVYYNLDQLKDVGIDKDHLPTTWDELESLLSRLREHSGKPPFVFGGDWYDYLFEATVHQAGGSLFDREHNRFAYDTPQAVEALRFWKGLKDKGLLVRATNWKATLNSFLAGLYPVTFYTSGGIESARAQSRFAWMADMLPRRRAYGATAGGGNLYLTARLDEGERKAALLLLRFLYTPSVQARISQASGFFPVVAAAFDEPQLKERYTTDEPFVRVRRQLGYTGPRGMSTDNLQMRKALKTAIDRCLDDNVPAETALRDAQGVVDHLGK